MGGSKLAHNSLQAVRMLILPVKKSTSGLATKPTPSLLMRYKTGRIAALLHTHVVAHAVMAGSSSPRVIDGE
eukprot:6213924-Pleurochrysis_carterae.AAC.6